MCTTSTHIFLVSTSQCQLRIFGFHCWRFDLFRQIPPQGTLRSCSLDEFSCASPLNYLRLFIANYWKINLILAFDVRALCTCYNIRTYGHLFIVRQSGFAVCMCGFHDSFDLIWILWCNYIHRWNLMRLNLHTFQYLNLFPQIVCNLVVPTLTQYCYSKSFAGAHIPLYSEIRIEKFIASTDVMQERGGRTRITLRKPTYSMFVLRPDTYEFPFAKPQAYVSISCSV